MSYCTCCIVPKDILDRLATDKRLSAELRRSAAQSARISDAIRGVRERAGLLTSVSFATGGHLVELGTAPQVVVYDCQHTQTLPGAPVKPTTKDPAAKRVFKETASVAKFYETVFSRNSIDNAGMTLVSSIHYGDKFNNAMWTGMQMLYGDGDGKIFIDFTKGNDVIGHELTHGVTQHSLHLSFSKRRGRPEREHVGLLWFHVPAVGSRSRCSSR
jgi:Zn-dependent metalloprotease